MSDDHDRTGLKPGEQGAEEMGGATGITGGGESGRPGEGVRSRDQHAGDEETGVTGGATATPDDDT